MTSPDLTDAIHGCQSQWEATIADLGPEGLHRPAVGRWRVRDIIAHFNGWDRWQLVQLASAFTGIVADPAETTGGLDIADPDPALPFVHGLNDAFVAANTDRALDAVLGDWRAVSALRAEWVASASDAHLAAVIGSDWHGIPGRYMRLAAEVPQVGDPRAAGRFVTDQIDHQLAHLAEVRAWMASPR